MEQSSYDKVRQASPLAAYGRDHPPDRNVLWKLVPVAITKNTANITSSHVSDWAVISTSEYIN